VKARQARGPLHFVIQEFVCCAESVFEQQRCAFGLLWLDREGALASEFCDWVVFFSGDGTSFCWVGRLSLGMEKSFTFSVDTSTTELQIQERRTSYAGAVSLGPRCVAWLIEMVEEVMRFTRVEEYVRSTREASNVVTIKRGGNRASCFLEVVVQGEGGRRGFIMLPEDRERRGWGRFSGELRKVLAFL
jgi:hypothetical protein